MKGFRPSCPIMKDGTSLVLAKRTAHSLPCIEGYLQDQALEILASRTHEILLMLQVHLLAAKNYPSLLRYAVSLIGGT